MKLNYKQSIELLSEIISHSKYNASIGDGSEFWINENLCYFSFDRSHNTVVIIDRNSREDITFELLTKDFEYLHNLFTDRTKKYDRTYNVPNSMIPDSIKRDIVISNLIDEKI